MSLNLKKAPLQEAVYLTVNDFDQQLNTLSFEPILLNDFPVRTKEDREALNDLVITTYNNTDVLESVPSCGCGAFRFACNENKVCKACGGRVESPMTKVIESNVWFRAPRNIKSLVSPFLWMVLSNLMRKSGYNVLEWFCNTNSYIEPPPQSNGRAWELIRRLERLGVPRGLNSFIENFDQMINFFVGCAKPPQRQDLLLFLTSYRDRWFPQHLPIPNKIAFVIENTPVGTFTDAPMASAIDACRTMTSLDDETKNSVRRMEGKIVSVINDLAEYYTYLFGKPFSRKEGWFRRDILGSRFGFAGRSVISSAAGVHDYETVKLPYSQAATMFSIHLINKLEKRGYSPRRAIEYVEQHLIDRDPLMEEMLMELVRDNPSGKGWPLLDIRYPTLNRASIQCLFFNGLLDTASTLSLLTVNGANADGHRSHPLQGAA